MNLVIDQVMQFQHIDDADCHWTFKDFTGPTIGQPDLARLLQARLGQHMVDVVFPCAIENRRGDWDTAGQVVGQFQNTVVIQALHFRLDFSGFVDTVQGFPKRGDLAAFLIAFQSAGNFIAQAGTGPTQMGFQNLPDIHTAGHPKRVQHDIDMGPIFQIGHVFNRHDLGDNTLVAVTTGHFIARLQLALHRNEDLDHLHDAWWQFIPGLNLFDLIVETGLNAGDAFVKLLAQNVQVVIGRGIIHRDLAQLTIGQLVQGGLFSNRPGLEALRPGRDFLA